MKLHLAVFIGPVVLRCFFQKNSNLTHENIVGLFREEFSEEISKLFLDETSDTEEPNVSYIFPDDVYVQVLDDVSLKFGNALAGYLGFCEDYTEDGSWHGVIEVESK